MPTTVYRRKALVVKATPSPGGSYWTVEEGGQKSVYTKEAFETLFEPIELQVDISNGPDTDMFGFDYSWCKGLENRSVINELLGIEMISIDNVIDGSSWMFKPYPLSTFGRMLNTVVKDMGADTSAPSVTGWAKFLEVGCGIGAKMVLAQKLFGLRVSGFDYNREYCNAATQLLQSRECKYWTVQVLDACSSDAVGLYKSTDILYLNRPFVHLDAEIVLEHRVMDSMHPGAYIILGNYASDVDTLITEGWRKIDEDKFAVVLQKRSPKASNTKTIHGEKHEPQA